MASMNIFFILFTVVTSLEASDDTLIKSRDDILQECINTNFECRMNAVKNRDKSLLDDLIYSDPKSNYKRVIEGMFIILLKTGDITSALYLDYHYGVIEKLGCQMDIVDFVEAAIESGDISIILYMLKSVSSDNYKDPIIAAAIKSGSREIFDIIIIKFAGMEGVNPKNYPFYIADAARSGNYDFFLYVTQFIPNQYIDYNRLLLAAIEPSHKSKSSSFLDSIMKFCPTQYNYDYNILLSAAVRSNNIVIVKKLFDMVQPSYSLDYNYISLFAKGNIKDFLKI
jgi:hypothetical protein